MIEQLLQADRLLQVDQTEKAASAYQGIRDLDPNNAIAVVGLARCALARGADHRAHELASEALQIDPENDMARRMEARLAEILTVRGETVSRPALVATAAPREMRPMVTGEIDTSTDPGSASTSTSTSTSAPVAAIPKQAPERRGFIARLMGR